MELHSRSDVRLHRLRGKIEGLYKNPSERNNTKLQKLEAALVRLENNAQRKQHRLAERDARM